MVPPGEAARGRCRVPLATGPGLESVSCLWLCEVVPAPVCLISGIGIFLELFRFPGLIDKEPETVASRWLCSTTPRETTSVRSRPGGALNSNSKRPF